MQNVDLFVFVLAGSSLRASAFICGMKGSSPRLGSWMCLHTAGTGLEARAERVSTSQSSAQHFVITHHPDTLRASRPKL